MSRLAVFLRLTSIVSMSFSLLLLGLALFVGGWEAAASGKSLQVVPPPGSLGDLLSGTNNYVTFSVKNLSTNPVRLAGVERVCMRWGCVKGVDFPVDVPPRATREFKLAVLTSRVFSGEFDDAIVLYSNASGSEQTLLPLVGRVVQPKGH